MSEAPRGPAADPYAPPRAAVEADPAQAARRAELRRARWIRLLGMMVAAFGLCLTLLFVWVLYDTGVGEVDALRLGINAAFVAISGLILASGVGLRAMAGRARWPVSAFLALVLLLPPIGTVFSAWGLYLLWSPTGRLVLRAGWAPAPMTVAERAVDWLVGGFCALLGVAVALGSMI